VLASRSRFPSSEAFRDEFLATLMHGVIPRRGFINWQAIARKVAANRNSLLFFSDLPSSRERFIAEFSDALTAHDHPEHILRACFELLGHTDGERYVSAEDNIVYADYRDGVDEATARDLATLFADLGTGEILFRELEDYFIGVQVGLESQRRKNIGGKAYVDLVRPILGEALAFLRQNGVPCDLYEEFGVVYADGKTRKKVDFCFKSGPRLVGVEVNFYTVSGSKPAEVKRSYGQAIEQCQRVNAQLAWITDGVGYEGMRNSLKEAFDIHKNIYNTRMAETELKRDLLAYFNTPT